MSFKLHAALAALAASLLLGYPVAHATTPEAAPADAPPPPAVPVFTVDKTSLSNGGVITVTGKTAPGKTVYIEVFNENPVTGSFFDSRPNKETGKIPYKLYMASEIPAYYRIHVPKETQPILDDFKKEGKGWSYSGALSNTGGEVVYREPGKHPITAYQASLQASIVGSRGEVLPTLDDKERVRRSMQIVKARFRTVDKLLAANIDQKEDGSFTAQIKIPEGSAPGKYTIIAATSKKAVSEPLVVENKIALPMIYMDNAGTSLNVFVPFFLVLALATFGVLMGAGGGFIINPVMLMMFPIPHNVVAGTVTPTVLFSQASGVVNYSKIKFISWKVGVTLGIAMLAGAFIGPVLTTMVTVDEFKFVFGWILFVLAALMFWQTTPGYLAKNKKEQAILKEFQKRAEEASAAKAARA
ncbi:MAG: sulfite exporter TauE/SafE family protein [Rhodocyclaceae bacterium]|nr:sulfite exporter TauE/SafE family protein [Rhodocyclaceae bacterium]